LAQRLDGISVLRMRLALHPGQGNTLHLRFALQNKQRVEKRTLPPISSG
jgi:hypothetical protein